MLRNAPPLVLICLLLFAFAVPAAAQGMRRDRPGDFDFYVLSLSWAPSFCAESEERSGREPAEECGVHAYAFVVHGLWPQYEQGFPLYCRVPAPRISRALVDAMRDVMPAPRLVYSEWNRHGTCSGLSPDAYFAEVRRARAAVKIPPQYQHLQRPLRVAPATVEDAFMTANPGIARGGIAVACAAGRLTEVRICLAKDLKFRNCADVVQHGCRRGQVLMPPPHGAGGPG